MILAGQTDRSTNCHFILNSCLVIEYLSVKHLQPTWWVLSQKTVLRDSRKTSTDRQAKRTRGVNTNVVANWNVSVMTRPCGNTSPISQWRRMASRILGKSCNNLFMLKTKKIWKSRMIVPLWGWSPVIFPSQMVSNVENVSLSWCHEPH